jgi:hypothetical protein
LAALAGLGGFAVKKNYQTAIAAMLSPRIFSLMLGLDQWDKVPR